MCYGPWLSCPAIFSLPYLEWYESLQPTLLPLKPNSSHSSCNHSITPTRPLLSKECNADFRIVKSHWSTHAMRLNRTHADALARLWTHRCLALERPIHLAKIWSASEHLCRSRFWIPSRVSQNPEATVRRWFAQLSYLRRNTWKYCVLSQVLTMIPRRSVGFCRCFVLPNIQSALGPLGRNTSAANTMRKRKADPRANSVNSIMKALAKSRLKSSVGYCQGDFFHLPRRRFGLHFDLRYPTTTSAGKPSSRWLAVLWPPRQNNPEPGR